MQNFIKIYQKGQGIGPVSLFSEFEPRQNLDLSQISLTISLATSCQYQCVCRIWSSANPRPIRNVSSQSLGLDLVNINVYATFITTFFTVLEIGPFSLFQNLELGKSSTDKKYQFAISWARSCQYQCVCKFHHNILHSFRDRTIFTFSEFGARQILDR